MKIYSKTSLKWRKILNFFWSFVVFISAHAIIKVLGRGLGGQFKSKGLSWRIRFRVFVYFMSFAQDLAYTSRKATRKMSSLRTFDSATTLTVTEGYDVTKQEHYFKKRCSCSCCDCFHKRCTFRVWQVLLFLFIVAVIIAALGLLLAMFGPGNTDIKYSSRSGTDSPGVVGKQISLVYHYLRVLNGVQLILLAMIGRGKQLK